MNTAAYQKARRDRARELGTCLVCTKRPMADGRSTCGRCHALKTSWNGHSAASGMREVAAQRAGVSFYICCQSHRQHRADCEQRAA